MTRAKAEAPNEKSGAGPEGRGRKSQEYGNGALGATATTDIYWSAEGIPATGVATHQGRTAERDVSTPTGAESRNPQAGRRCQDVGDTHGP